MTPTILQLYFSTRVIDLVYKSSLMYNKYKEKIMNAFINVIQKCFFFEKEPQRIGLTQFKEPPAVKKAETPSIKNKDVKLSDLMRRH